ncbi:hypothetical protein MKW92_014741 [Papaver armeniacum]|nr:hypothetical protein MKW92_014741 [Papaver armeniacum]
MAVPEAPLSLIAFFFLFTFVASQSMNAGVLKTMGAPGEACLMALDIPGPANSCDDRLRIAEALNVREALRGIQDLHKKFLQVLTPNQEKYFQNLEDLVGSKHYNKNIHGSFLESVI